MHSLLRARISKILYKKEEIWFSLFFSPLKQTSGYAKFNHEYSLCLCYDCYISHTKIFPFSWCLCFEQQSILSLDFKNNKNENCVQQLSVSKQFGFVSQMWHNLAFDKQTSLWKFATGQATRWASISFFYTFHFKRLPYCVVAAVWRLPLL